MKEKVDYIVLCDCGTPKPIPPFIFKNYIAEGIDYVYCNYCDEKMTLPKSVMKLAQDNE